MITTPQDASKTLFQSPTVELGRFDLPVSAPRFAAVDATRCHVVVFPRSSVWICPEREAAYVAHPATVCFYNGRQPYSRRAIEASGECCDWLAVDDETLHSMMGLTRIRPTPFRRTHAPMDGRSSILQRAIVRQALEEPEVDVLRVEQACLDILEQVVGLAARPRLERLSSMDRIDLSAAVEETCARLVAAGPQQQWSLSSLAAEVALSPYQLSRAFRRFSGASLPRWCAAIKVFKSIDLVFERPGDLAAVAEAVGFATNSSFTTCFRRILGIPPSAILRQMKSLPALR